MKINPKDLEIFVLTYNRSDLLKQTLVSICNQTEKGFRIIVLDNNSTDNTSDVVNSFKKFNVELNKSTKNIGGIKNLIRAKKLASRKYVMVFHDDDLMHPDYIKVALSFISNNPGVAMVGSTMSFEENPQNKDWPKFNNKAIYCKNQKEFTKILFNGFCFHFGSAIYRTDLFKSIPFESEVYGKILDRPFLINIVEHGSVYVLKDPYIRYRHHSNQDSLDNKSGPFIPQLIALHKKYLSILGDNPLKSSGRTFILRNYIYLYKEYPRLVDKKDMTFKQYVFLTTKKEGSTKLANICGIILKNTIYKIFYHN